jgi:sucrose-6-phosphate hydrolase SacC (GH32 family)
MNKLTKPMLQVATFLMALCLFSPTSLHGQVARGQTAAKPLFRDPVYDGAADPTVIWNSKEKKWFMFYTNRRANVSGLDGVTWVHGTRIGIAESTDKGRTWQYRDTCDIQYRLTDYTHWAPEVIEYKGIYHMYLSYVPGVFKDWNHPRWIIHLTSTNLINWNFESKLDLSSDRCIDACIFRLPDKSWRMYYNNERDGKSMYYANSPDLYKWSDSGKKVVGDRAGEGANVFRWKGTYWMVVDNWNGLGVYSSSDLTNWTRQPENILKTPGKGADDQVIGGHPDVVVSGEKAYIFYFTHPGRTPENKGKDNYQTRRSSIQVAELAYEDGKITCDRDKPVLIRLQKPKTQ